MTRKRRSIPRPMEDELLFRYDHTCCICRAHGKDVQIHHIDGNRDNHKYDNLIVLCLDHHSQATGKRGLGKMFTPGELRKYKRSWEKQVMDSRGVRRPRVRYKKELVSQIDLIICDILVRRPDDRRARELLDLLYELYLYRGDEEMAQRIIQGMEHLAVMLGISSPVLAQYLPEKAWALCWHFVGPDEVPMDKRDAARVVRCAGILETLAVFNCNSGHGRKAMLSLVENAEHIFEIALWYAKRQIANAVIRVYREGLENCRANGESEFAYGRRILRRSLRKLQRLLTENQPAWSRQSRRLMELLAQ